jgi:hypothetical protein
MSYYPHSPAAENKERCGFYGLTSRTTASLPGGGSAETEKLRLGRWRYARVLAASQTKGTSV